MSEPNKCQNPPAYRYTWPGGNEKFICAIHAVQLQNIVIAMGLRVQMIPLGVSDYLNYLGAECSQEEKG
jgi:hypothetical protein